MASKREKVKLSAEMKRQRKEQLREMMRKKKRKKGSDSSNPERVKMSGYLASKLESKRINCKSNKITGIVKEWIHEKNFGFILRDDDRTTLLCNKRDVYLNPIHSNPKVGSKVSFIVGKTGTISNVTALDGGQCEGSRSMGIIKEWNWEKRYGFITPDDGGDDLLVSLDLDVWASQDEVFNIGDAVEFDPKDGNAVYVTKKGQRVEQQLIITKPPPISITPEKEKEKKRVRFEEDSKDNVMSFLEDDNGSENEEEEEVDADSTLPPLLTPGKETGFIKSWNHTKRCGSIIQENALNDWIVFWAEDVFMDWEKYDCPKVGSAVEFYIQDDGFKKRKHKNMKATNVSSFGGRECEGGRSSGIIKHWDIMRNEGVIEAHDGTGDYPFSKKDLAMSSKVVHYIKKGDQVEYDSIIVDNQMTRRAGLITLKRGNNGVKIRKCKRCGGFGHDSNVCSATYKPKSYGPGAADDDSKALCFECGQMGHAATRCPLFM